MSAAVEYLHKKLPPFGRLPSSTIQISRVEFPHLQQKILNSIVYAVSTGTAKKISIRNNTVTKAIGNMGLVDWYIETSILRKLAQFNSNNYESFEQAISGLNGRTVDYNILAKDKEKTLVCPECQTYMMQDGDQLDAKQVLVCPACKTRVTRSSTDLMTTIYASSVLFDTIISHQGVIYFSFGRLMTYFLEKAKKRFYCKFLPDVANALNRGPSHAIYLLLLDYIDEKKGVGTLPFVDIETFGKLVGGEKYIKNFKDLRVNVIEPSVKEITEKTNITAVFEQDYDTKKAGRKIIALRIRGQIKKSTQPQLPGLEFEEIELFGTSVRVEEFLDFLSRNAKNIDAYKSVMRQALQAGTIENLKSRFDEFIAYKETERERIAQEERIEKAKSFHETLDLIAQQSKNSRLADLYVKDTNGNFYLFANLLDRGGFYDVASQLITKERRDIESSIYTLQEKHALEMDEADLYKKTFIPALLSIAPIKDWQIIIEDNIYTLSFTSKGFDFPIHPVRRAINAIKAGKEVVFTALSKEYTPSFEGSVLTLVEKTNKKERR